VIVYYLFAPFPWRISNIFDVVASAEGVLRIIALWITLKYTVYKPTFGKQFKTVCVIAFMLVFVWAGGTSNYGTASRHHLTTNLAFLLPFILMYSNAIRSLK
ncbi:hypothetical protein OAI26_07650, partial [Sulfitobacter sp.]|nr:hypothetical protein [Sulfitobacter sp.]